MLPYLFAFVTLLATAFAPLPAAARPLRILTYNIHHALGRDGHYDVERIASVINGADPDLVALQEVDQGTSRSGPGDMQLDMLAQLTSMNGYFGKTINRLGGEYGNAFLVKPDISVVRNENHSMPNPADGEPRSIMEFGLSFYDDGTPRQFDFFATHFDHTSGANRQAQVGYINDLVKNSDVPAILAGDFNFNNESIAYGKLMKQWSDPTATNPGRPNQIDYVVNRETDQWSIVQQGQFIVNSLTADASDHYPLLAVLELTPYSADFDSDGDVDGADFLLWQRHSGSTGVGILGDANHDHIVDRSDFIIWTRQYGTNAMAAQATAIPEPSSDSLIAIALFLAVSLFVPYRH